MQKNGKKDKKQDISYKNKGILLVKKMKIRCLHIVKLTKNNSKIVQNDEKIKDDCIILSKCYNEITNKWVIQ